MRLKNRKGAILVLAAFLMVVVLSMLVVVVDFSKIYVQKNELQTAADAAALAGVMEQAAGFSNQMVKDTATYYGQLNKAVGEGIAIAAADIHCGYWDDVAKTYSDDAGTCDFGHNAVTVTTRAFSTNSLPGILGGIFQVKATGRAYSAFVGATTCIKPWAIPYTTLTLKLQPSNTDSLRVLDTMDLRLLRELEEADRTFLLKLGDPASGNFGSLRIPDPNDPNINGGNLYKSNIINCNGTLIGPGDILETQTGKMTQPTIDSIEEYCTAYGTFNSSTGECEDTYGNPGIIVKAALWSQATPKNGGLYDVIVRQIVSFRLIQVGLKDASVTGAFLPYLTNGSIVTTPTTVQRPILVK